MKSGLVAVVGRPNAGKSTFVNAFLSKKVSIVSPKAQTTRDNILGIYHEKDLEIALSDTPGIFEGKEGLYKLMLKNVKGALQGADCVFYLIDASKGDNEGEAKTIKDLRLSIPLIIGYNKIDLVTVPEGQAAREFFTKTFPNAKFIELSALRNYGLAECKEAFKAYMPEGPAFYEENRYSDHGQEFMAREVIREKMLRFLKDEIPHTAAVKIDSFTKKGDSISIEATVYVDSKGHLPIVVGKNGEMVKKISMAARQQMEKDFHAHVSLYLDCKAAPNWRSSAKWLAYLGYAGND